MGTTVARLRHALLCRLLGFAEITRRLPEEACLRTPFAVCDRCGRVLRCLLVVTTPPPPSVAELALMRVQARRLDEQLAALAEERRAR